MDTRDEEQVLRTAIAKGMLQPEEKELGRTLFRQHGPGVFQAFLKCRERQVQEDASVIYRHLGIRPEKSH